MRNLILLPILFLAFNLTAQVDWYEVMEQNSARNYIGNLGQYGEELNTCVDIKGTDYHPLSYAIKLGSTEIIDYLITHEDLQPDTDCGGGSILMHAIKYGTKEHIRILMRSGADMSHALAIAKEFDKPEVYGYLKTIL